MITVEIHRLKYVWMHAIKEKILVNQSDALHNTVYQMN